MEEITEYKVYIEINENKEIIKIFSDCFDEPSENSIFIDKGCGDKYVHAQGNYFKHSLMDDEGNYRYFYDNGNIIEKGV